MLPLLLLCYFSKGADRQSCEDQHCFNEHIEGDGPTVFAHACKMRLEGVVSKRKDSAYRSGRSPDWLKMKNAAAPAVKREAEEDWGFREGSPCSTQDDASSSRCWAARRQRGRSRRARSRRRCR